MLHAALRIAAVALAFALPLQAVAAQSDAALRAGLKADLDQYLRARAKPEHISAASVSVSFPGSSRTIDVAAGTMRFDGGPAVTPANLFQIGSNTKAFTAVMLLQLEAEGKLRIDQTIGRWFPEYPAWRNVTIRHLLDMTSGIPTYDAEYRMLSAYAAHPRRDWTPKQLIAYVYPRIHRPAGWLYSNTGYVLCELIIERVTHDSYGNELRRRLLQNPALRLSDTYYSSNLYPTSVTDRLVSGYFASTDPDNAGLAPILYRDTRLFSLSWARAAGAIVSTPADVTRWTRALYEGPVLRAQQRRELESIVSQKTGQPIRAASATEGHGFGLGVGQLYVPGMGRIWFYEGMTLGYRVLYAYQPSSRLLFAVGLNSQPNSKENRSGQLMQTIYKRLKASGRV